MSSKVVSRNPLCPSHGVGPTLTAAALEDVVGRINGQNAAAEAADTTTRRERMIMAGWGRSAPAGFDHHSNSDID